MDWFTVLREYKDTRTGGAVFLLTLVGLPALALFAMYVFGKFCDLMAWLWAGCMVWVDWLIGIDWVAVSMPLLQAFCGACLLCAGVVAAFGLFWKPTQARQPVRNKLPRA